MVLVGKPIRDCLVSLFACSSSPFRFLRIPNEKNSFTVKEISNVCKELNISCIKQKNISTAKNYLLNKIKPEKELITGSLYLVGRVKKSLV